MKYKIKKMWEHLYNQYNEIKCPTIFTILVLLACFFSIQILQGQIGADEEICFLFLAYIGGQKLPQILNGIKTKYKGVFDRVMLLMICFLATFCETGAYYLEDIYSNPFSVLPFFILSFAWVSVIVLLFIYYGNRLLENIDFASTDGFSLKTNIVMFAVCVALCMFCNYAFNPAITSPDSQYCYSYAFHLGEEPISDGHPVFYIMLLRLCTIITSDIQFMIFVQAICYALIITYAMNVLSQIGISKKICVLIYVFVGLGFNTIIQIATLWKDIPFTISLVWLTLLLVKMCVKQEECSKQFGWYIQYVISTVLTALIRHNGLLPVIATLTLAVLLLNNKKKIIISSIIATLIIITVKGPIYSNYQVGKAPGLKFYAMANDIMYLYYHADCNEDESIMRVVNDVTNGDPQNFSYNAYYTSGMGTSLDHYSVPEFLNIYFHAWYVHPKIMLKGFLTRNTVIWSIDRAAYEIAGCVEYLGEYHDVSYPEQYPNRVNNYFTGHLTTIFSKLSGYHIIYALYWKTAIYNLLMIMGIVLILIKYKGKFWMPVLPFVPIMVNVFALLMTSGWPDYRYYWPSMLIAALLIPYTAIVLARQNSKTLLEIANFRMKEE